MIKYPEEEVTFEKIQKNGESYRRIDFGSHTRVQWERFNSKEMSWEVIVGDRKDELEDEYLNVDTSGIAVG